MVAARAALYSAQTANAKIVHTEADGIYDKMLLNLASGYTVSGVNQIEGRIEADSLAVHLLIFKITDGVSEFVSHIPTRATSAISRPPPPGLEF